MSKTGSGRLRRVMVNDEEQHSPWSADREPPTAWRHEGFTGTEAECSEHIDEVLDRHAPRVAAPVDGAARRLRGRLTDTSRRPAETAAANLESDRGMGADGAACAAGAAWARGSRAEHGKAEGRSQAGGLWAARQRGQATAIGPRARPPFLGRSRARS